MIDVKATIFNTLKTTFDKMRLLGINDTSFLKKIMFLTVLDDIYDWSDYLDDKQSILKRLQELRTNFILCNPEFDVCRFPFDLHYVNVNTPQTNYTWKRVWDAPDVVTIESVEQESETTANARPFTPDSTCPVSLTYFGTGEIIPADKYGKPSVNFDTLTICEKMNIYINRDTGKMFFLDPLTCTWKALKGEFASQVTWDSIIDAPEIIGGINHTITGEVGETDNQLNVSLTKAEYNKNTGEWSYGDLTSDIKVTDSNPEPEYNQDLNDIL